MSNWAHSQGAYNMSTTVGQLSLNFTFGAIAKGDFILIGVITLGAGITVTVKDSANNSYNQTASSPSNAQDATAGSSWLFWLESDGTATTSITVTLSSNPNGVLGVFADSFTPTGDGYFVKDAAGSDASVTRQTNKPSLPVDGGQLMYAHGAFSIASTGVAGPWIQNGHGPGQFSENAAWILNTNSSPIAVNFQFSGTENYDTTVAVFNAGNSIVVRHPR